MSSRSAVAMARRTASLAVIYRNHLRYEVAIFINDWRATCLTTFEQVTDPQINGQVDFACF